MNTLGIEAIISLVLAGLTLIVTFIGHYFYVRGKLHKAAAGAITNAEQDDKTGEEKLELAVDQVYGLVPTSLKVFIHRRTVRKIVQAAFDKIEDYAKKQVEKKSKKKEEDGSSADENDESESAPQSEIIVSPQSDEFSDSGGEHEEIDEENNEQLNSETDWQTLDDMISLNADVRSEIAVTLDDTAPDEQSDNQVKQSKACSINKNSNQEKIIMENNNINNVIDNANNAVINDEPVTCYEDIGASTEYSKQFTNPKTGLHTAVLFSSPIDNNDGISTAADGDDFIDALNDEGEEVYENRRNKFLVRLAKSTAQNKLVELIQDDYKIAMSPVAAVTSKLNRFVGTIRRDIQAIRNLRRDPKAAKNKITELIHGAVKFALKDREPSDVRFANIINNCDLEYLVENNRLKENIIVNARSEAYEYLFNLNLGKLEARMSGKQIELYDAATNEVKFLIPAPFMYDMANQQSDAVEYMLEGSAGNYTLRVIADEAWINSDARQFPVVIDPQITANTETIISFKGGTRTGNFTTPTGDCITIGNNHYSNADHEYTAQITLHGNAIRQHIGKELKVTHAILELTKVGDDRVSNSAGFNVHKDNITGVVVDRFMYNGINNRIEIDITDQIQEIIDGATDKSLYIDRVNTDSATDYILIATALAANAEYKPRIFIDYVSARINTDDMPFASASAGKGGSGKVNLVTGNFLWEIPEIQIKSRGVELGVSHVYDGYLAGKDQDYINSANTTLPKTPKLCCGKGFKLNIQQYLLEKKYGSEVSLMGTRNYVYIDGSGNHHDFVEKYYYTDDNNCKRFVERINCEEDEIGNLTYTDINNKTYDVKNGIDNELGLTLETYKDLLSYVLEGKAYTVSYYRIENGKKVSVPADRANESGVYAERDYKDGIKVGISDKLDIKEVEEAKAAVDECQLKLEEINQQILAGGSQSYLDLLQSKKKRYEAELADKTTKFNKAISDKKRNPVDFITDGNGQTLGFDYYGRLVLIGNGSESGSAFIIYNTDDRIERVVDKDGVPLAAFGYKEDLLEYMTDKNGKTFRYKYDGSKRLSNISYGDEVLCELTYNNAHRLEFVGKKIDGKVLSGAKIVYSGVKPTKLQEYSEMSKISETECTPAISALYSKKLLITYVDRYMTDLKDEKTNIITTYIMDNMGRIVTVYEGSGSNTKSVSVEYRERKRAFSSNDLFTDNEKITYAESGLTAVSTRKPYTMDSSAKIAKIPKSGMLLLSAWATAQSFNLIYDRRQTAYGDDIFGHYELDANNSADVQRSNRKFGLFATVYYSDGTAPDEHYASFDYYNPHKQLGILPVFVQPSKIEKVSKIVYGVDYSYNNGTADFEDLKLTTCKGGTYREFDDDDMLIKETTDDGVAEYEYADKMPIKATFTRFRDGKSFVSLRDYDTMGRERFTRDFDGNCKATFYDDNGMVSKTEEYHESDTTTKRVKEYKYDNDGNVMYESDERGESGGHELYNINYIDDGVTTRTRNSGGAVTAMGYDRYTGENTGLSGDADGDPNTAQYTYKHGMMTSATHNGVRLEYFYDGLGRSLFVVEKITNQDYARTDDYRTIVSHTYNDGYNGSDSYVTSLYCGATFTTVSDSKGRTKYVGLGSGTAASANKILEYTYDDNHEDRVKGMYESYGGVSITYEYKYSGNNLSESKSTRNGVTATINNTYDDLDEITKKSVTVSDGTDTVSSSVTYRYADKHGSTKRRIEYIDYQDLGFIVLPSEDALGRVSGMSINCVTNEGGKPSPYFAYNEDVYYIKHGDRTCDLPASERFGLKNQKQEHVKYKYDAAGNISEVIENGETVATYTYDSLNRLITEKHAHVDISFEIINGNRVSRKTPITKTKTYTYDVGGNIISKKVYDGKTDLPCKEYQYSYDSNYPDRLKTLTITDREKDSADKYYYKHSTEVYVVDDYGRFTTYRGKSLSWDAIGRLSALGSTSFKYSLNGVRLSKKTGDKETKFFVDGKRIVYSVDNAHKIWYYYDAQGVVGIKVDDAKYFFHRNALGDVTRIYKHIYDKNYELVARYEYDAWGNHKVYNADGTENTSDDFIGNINPIRYRGYYYDVETGLYYLNARYYDPELCRFVSADETQYLDPQSVNGLNLFAYCGNNPVMNVDPEGTSWWKRFWKKVATALTVIAAVVAVVVGVVATVASMVVAGPAAAFGLAVLGAALTGMGSAMISNINAQVKTNGWENVNLGQTWTAGAIGLATGAITGAISFGVGQVAQGIGETFGYLLGNTKIGGLLVSKVFNPQILSKAFGVTFGAAGGLGAGLFGDYIGSDIFNLSFSPKDSLNSTFFDWLLQFGHWLFNL